MPSSESQNRHPNVRFQNHADHLLAPLKGSTATLHRVRSLGQEYLRAEKTLGLRKRAHFRRGPDPSAFLARLLPSTVSQVSGATLTIIRRLRARANSLPTEEKAKLDCITGLYCSFTGRPSLLHRR